MKILPNQLKNQVLKNQQNRQNLSQNQDDQNLSPNLLAFEFLPQTFYTKHQKEISKWVKILIFSLQSVFLLLIGINYLLNQRLETEKDKTQILTAALKERQIVFDEARLLNKKIGIYKKVTSTTHLLSNDLEAILSSVPQNVGVNSINFADQTTGLVQSNISITTASALNVASLITNLFTNQSTAEVSILSATLDTSANVYRVQLQVNFKK